MKNELHRGREKKERDVATRGEVIHCIPPELSAQIQKTRKEMDRYLNLLMAKKKVEGIIEGLWHMGIQVPSLSVDFNSSLDVIQTGVRNRISWPWRLCVRESDLEMLECFHEDLVEAKIEMMRSAPQFLDDVRQARRQVEWHMAHAVKKIEAVRKNGPVHQWTQRLINDFEQEREWLQPIMDNIPPL